jgi:hypothetical protein
VQNEPPVAQTPLVQSFEQHCALPVQALPAVWQPGLSGVQVPVGPHVPLQHWAELVHAWRSEVHCDEPHLPASHTNVQHSCGTEHELPAALHGPITCEQILAPGSQLPVQHSLSAAQLSPTSLSVHEDPLPPLPLVPPVEPPEPAEPELLPALPPVAVGPVMASVPEEPHPMAQSPEPNTATKAPSTSFLTPTSTRLGSSDTAPWLAAVAWANGSPFENLRRLRRRLL